MKIKAGIQSSYQKIGTTVSTNDAQQQIDISAKSTGYGSAVNGGELLLLALATCFCNDIYREAAQKNIRVTAVEVECEADFGAAGEPGSNFIYKARVEADAGPGEIEALLQHTNNVAEIHNTLRKGTSVTLVL